MTGRSRPVRSPIADGQMSRTLPVVALVLLSAAGVTILSVMVPLLTVAYGVPLALSFLLSAALCAVPLLFLVAPRTALTLFALAVIALPVVVDSVQARSAPWPWSVPALLAFILVIVTITLHGGFRRGALVLIIGVGASLAAPLLRGDLTSTADAAAVVTANLIVAASCAVVAYVIAALIRARRNVAAELEREREHTAVEQARRALVEERTRIARELHDVIAHSLSVIQVQSSTARFRIPDIAEGAAQEFDDIAATARRSLTEMRRMLGVLRTEDHAAELAPQHRISDIPSLIETMRRTGVGISLSIENAQLSATASEGVQIAAYRIVQEALSNAVRHAPGSTVAVRLTTDEGMLRVHIRNEASTSPPPPHAGGFGLRGMRERAEALGGSLSAGPGVDGGWTVDAALPLTADPPSPSPIDKETA